MKRWNALMCGLMLAGSVWQVHASEPKRGLGVTSGQLQLQLNGGQSVKLYANSYALVIGASHYTAGWPQLPGVLKDIQEVKLALEANGFKVVEVKNPTRDQMDGALRQFIGDYGQESQNRLIVYYAGHGHTLKTTDGRQQGYIVPVDAPLPDSNVGAFKKQALGMEAIEGYARQIDSKHALFVFDSCFAGTFFKMRAVPENISQKTAQPVRQFITAGGADQPVPDVSVFRRQFITGIQGTADLNKDGYVTGSELGSFLEDTVTNYSRSTQTPQYGKIRDPDLDQGDFVFALPTQLASLEPIPVPRPVEPPAVTAHAKTKEQIEDDYWGEIKDSNDISSYEQYRRVYPKGRYLNTANLKLAQLKKQVQPPAPPVIVREDPEAALWVEVQKGNSVEDYRAYLAQYPKGKYAVLAKGRLAKFETDAADASRVQREAAAQQLAQQEQGAWELANNSASEAGYQSYLNSYPRGKYATLASGRITKLRNDAAQAQQAAERQRQQAEAVSASAQGPAMVAIPGRNYELGKFEVTHKEWREVMGSNPSWFSNCGDNCPVEQVSWDDIQTFLQKLNVKTGRQYRLPNETEWEYACYGGSKTECCGGNDINAVAWYEENSNSTTHPVGQKQANGYGLYDMSGNVWEWMENKYDNEHDWRALRGGSWGSAPQGVRASYRLDSWPAFRNYNFGFRLARTLP